MTLRERIEAAVGVLIGAKALLIVRHGEDTDELVRVADALSLTFLTSDAVMPGTFIVTSDRYSVDGQLSG